jgi:beta-lactamase superfamily II metal-dependent hydrolase
MEASLIKRRSRHAMRPLIRGLIVLVALLFCVLPQASAKFTPSGQLEIQYINVGQGGCTLIIGPDGTRILYDSGKVAGTSDIVPYLRDVVGLAPQDGLQYTVVSHGDKVIT